MAGKELTLGVVFSGRIGKELETAVARLEGLVKGLNGTLGKIQQSGGVQALAALAKQTNDTSAAMTVLGNTSKAATATMSTSIGNAGKSVGEFGKAMTRAQANGSGFVTTLQELTKYSQRNTLEVKDAEKAMYKTDAVLRQLNREVANGSIQTSLANNNWKYAKDRYVDFKNAADLTTISQKVLNGEITASRKGITEYIGQVTKGNVTLSAFTNVAKGTMPGISGMNKAIDDGNLSWQEAARTQAAYQAAISKSLPAQKASASAIMEVSKASKNTWPVIEQMNRAIDSGNISWQAVSRQQSAYQSALKGTLPIQQQTTASVDNFTKASKNAWPAINQMNKAIDAGNISWQEVSRLQSGYQSALKGTLPIQQQTTQQIKSTSTSIDYLTKAHGQLGPTITSMNRAIDAGTMSWQNASRQQSAYQSALKGTLPAQQSMGTTTAKLSDNLTYLGQKLGISNVEMAKIGASTKTASEPFNFLGKQIGSVNGAIDRLKAAFKVTAAYGLASTAIYTLINAFKIGAQSIIDYDQALKNLQAITGATDAEVGAMGKTILDVARTTKFSSTEIADGMVLLGQAGFSASEAMDAIGATANLATGTLSSMALTTDLLTTTIRAFNLDTIESGRVADVMANAINKSKLTIDKLRISFSYIAATASMAGLSLEETAASMMVLANNGLRASTIGTGLRQVLSRLLSPNTKLREAYEAHGIALDQINPKTVGYQTALQNLAKVLYNSETKVVDVSKAFELFGLRGAQTAAILVRDYAGGAFQTALKSVFEVGTSSAMAAKQSEGLGIQFKNLADRAKIVAVAFGGAGVSGAISIFVSILRTGTEWLELFATSGIGQVIIKAGLLVASFAALRGAAIFLMSAIKGLAVIEFFNTAMAAAIYHSAGAVTGLTKLRAAFTALWLVVSKNPIGLIITGISLAAAAFSHFMGASDKLASSLGQQAIEAEKIEKGLSVYADTIGLAKEGSDEYLSALKRFGETYPGVTQKILDMNGAIDLADIAVGDITKSMRELAGIFLQESISKTQRALTLYKDDLDRATIAGRNLYEILFKQGNLDDFLAEKKDKLTSAQNALIQSYKRGVEIGELTIDEAFKLIDALGLQEDKLKVVKDGFTAHFNGVKLGSSEAASGMKTAFDGVPEYFVDLYRTLDASRQADLVQAMKTMQSQVAAYRKTAEDMGIADWDRDKQVEAIRKVAYDKFVESLNKESVATQKKNDKDTEDLQKALKKKQEAYEKSAEQIKSIEEKMAEDSRTLRQLKMTEEQKLNDNLLDARAARAKAEIMLAQATTQEELDAAIKQVEVARAKYSDILKVALESKKQQIDASKIVSASESQVADTTYDKWVKFYKDMGTNITTYTTTYTSESKKKESISKSTADKVVADNDRANKSMDEQMLQALERIKKTGGGITTEFDNMKTKAAEPKPINIVEEPAKTSIKTTQLGLIDLGTRAEKEKPININSYAAVSNIQKAIDKIKELIAAISAIPRDVNVNVNVTSTGTGSGQTSLAAGVTEATSQIQEFTATVGASSGDTSGSSSGAVFNVGFTGSGSTTKPLGDKIKEAIGWVKDLADTVTIGAKMMVSFTGHGSDEKPLSEKIDELDSEISTFGDSTSSTLTSVSNKTAETGSDISSTANNTASSIESAFTSAIDAIISKIDELVTKLTEATSSSFAGMEIVTTPGLMGNMVAAYDMETGSILWRRFDAYRKGGAIGLSEGGSLKDSGGKLSGYGGGDTIPAMLEKGEFVVRKEAVKKYGSGLFSSLNGMVQKFASGGLVDNPILKKLFFFGQGYDTNQGVLNGLSEILGDLTNPGQMADRLFLNATGDNLKIKRNSYGQLGTWGTPRWFNEFRTALPELVDTLGGSAATAGSGPNIPDILQNMNEIAHLISPGEWGLGGLIKRLAAGGNLTGYGGGDTIPAVLEKGEFVIRKEAVKKYGAGLFANLNSMVAGMKIGGLVARPAMPRFAEGGSVQSQTGGGFSLSNQLHTINLTINNAKHTLYGDDQAVKGLIKTLRREQLVMA
jgi:TP901 family phage tail tape measure protein